MRQYVLTSLFSYRKKRTVTLFHISIREQSHGFFFQLPRETSLCNQGLFQLDFVITRILGSLKHFVCIYEKNWGFIYFQLYSPRSSQMMNWKSGFTLKWIWLDLEINMVTRITLIDSFCWHTQDAQRFSGLGTQIINFCRLKIVLAYIGWRRGRCQRGKLMYYLKKTCPI